MQLNSTANETEWSVSASRGSNFSTEPSANPYVGSTKYFPKEADIDPSFHWTKRIASRLTGSERTSKQAQFGELEANVVLSLLIIRHNFGGIWERLPTHPVATLDRGIANLSRDKLKQQIRNLKETAGSNNWDGEGALAIREEAIEIALKLADTLPAEIENPDVAATPHGEIDFDWVASRNAMLTLSVNSDGELAWAALFEEFSCRGTAPWTGELACPLICCLRELASKVR